MTYFIISAAMDYLLHHPLFNDYFIISAAMDYLLHHPISLLILSFQLRWTICYIIPFHYLFYHFSCDGLSATSSRFIIYFIISAAMDYLLHHPLFNDYFIISAAMDYLLHHSLFNDYFIISAAMDYLLHHPLFNDYFIISAAMDYLLHHPISLLILSFQLPWTICYIIPCLITYFIISAAMDYLLHHPLFNYLFYHFSCHGLSATSSPV